MIKAPRSNQEKQEENNRIVAPGRVKALGKKIRIRLKALG